MKWAILRRQDIPDIEDPSRTYLTRWRLIDTPWGSVFIHKIHMSDGDRSLHDHPWSMRSLILRGGYDEQWAASFDAVSKGEVEWRRHRAGTTYGMGRTEFHAIRTLHRNPTWTLVFAGPVIGGWGYATKDGWVQHDRWHRGRWSVAQRAVIDGLAKQATPTVIDDSDRAST